MDYEAHDEELIAAAARGEERAFETLFSKYAAYLAKFIRCFLHGKGCRTSADHAEDIESNTWKAAWHELKALREHDHFQYWLTKIAVHEVYRHLRTCIRDQRAFAQNEIEDPYVAVAAAIQSTEDIIIASIDAKRILKTAASISHECYQAMLLHDVLGMSFQEVSELRGIPLATARTQYYRHRTKIQEKLGVSKAVCPKG